MPHLPTFLTDLTTCLQNGRFIKMTLGAYAGLEDGLKNIYVRKVTIKGAEHISLTYRYKTRDIVKNHPVENAAEVIGGLLGAGGFRSAALFTADADIHYEDIKGRKSGLRRAKPTAVPADATGGAHNREKNRMVDTSAPYLHALGVTDAGGNVVKSAQDKYRQIDKYVEILSSLVKPLPESACLRVVDMGSGKGYLTFALFDHLTRGMGRTAAVTGVEYRQDMVDLCNRTAAAHGMAGLSFAQGTIEKYDDTGGVDILIALHACDTATDDAIARGIAAGAALIVTAPCCHKEVRREMEKSGRDNDLSFALRHGIFMERQAEMATDALRALLLEYMGYSVKVFEFISDAHTPKNVMIAATKNPRATPRDPAVRAKIDAAMRYFGITHQHLAAALGI
jgi:SAM-dependent methyltransferase